MQPPVMPEDGHTTRVTSGEDASSSAAGKDTNALEALWDDKDTRAFYECLPDLRAFVPAVLLGEAEPKANEHSVKTQDQSNIKANPPKIWQRFLQSLALCRREKVQRRGRIRKKKIKKR
uniref:Uncharacterized protein n=1 Tax=Salix viminalis TaxID=40686 RepID=A0A6N2K4S7_SALVM